MYDYKPPYLRRPRPTVGDQRYDIGRYADDGSTPTADAMTRMFRAKAKDLSVEERQALADKYKARSYAINQLRKRSGNGTRRPDFYRRFIELRHELATEFLRYTEDEREVQEWSERLGLLNAKLTKLPDYIQNSAEAIDRHLVHTHPFYWRNRCAQQNT